jgi:hypothetical protein
MSTDAFKNACDRLARDLDPNEFEKRRWEKDEGAKLNRVADLIKEVFSAREDLQVQSTTSTVDARGLLLTLGSTKVAQLTAKLTQGGITVWAVEVEDGVGSVPPTTNIPGLIPLNNITPEAVADAVADALNRINT